MHDLGVPPLLGRLQIRLNKEVREMVSQTAGPWDCWCVCVRTAFGIIHVRMFLHGHTQTYVYIYICRLHIPYIHSAPMHGHVDIRILIQMHFRY